HHAIQNLSATTSSSLSAFCRDDRRGPQIQASSQLAAMAATAGDGAACPAFPWPNDG
ncbi:hypothetical protein ABZP36_032913, partial [Zizania latifolia]